MSPRLHRLGSGIDLGQLERQVELVQAGQTGRLIEPAPERNPRPEQTQAGKPGTWVDEREQRVPLDRPPGR